MTSVARQRSRTLSAEERLEIMLVMEDMLLKSARDVTMINVVRLRYSVSEKVARNLLRKTREKVAEGVEKDQPWRRRLYLAKVDRLHEAAFEKGQLGVALGVLRLQGKVEGHDKPKDSGSAASSAKAEALRATEEAAAQAAAATAGGGSEFDGRSEEELDYYARTGVWPEEALDDEDDEGGGEGGPPSFPLD